MSHTPQPETAETTGLTPASALTRPKGRSIQVQVTAAVTGLVRKYHRTSPVPAHHPAFETHDLLDLFRGLKEMAQAGLRGMNVAAVIRGLLREEIPDDNLRSSLGVLLLYAEYEQYKARAVSNIGKPWQTEAGEQLYLWWANGGHPRGIDTTINLRKQPAFSWAMSLAPQLCPEETMNVLKSHRLITSP